MAGSLRRYRHWLGRRLLGVPRSHRDRATPPAPPHPRQPPVPCFGFALGDLRERLAAVAIDDSPPGALAGYARQDLERFLRTVELVPEGEGRALEIGANPYFTSLLLGWLRPALTLQVTNYFGEAEGHTGRQTVVVEGPAGPETRSFDYRSVNVETQRLPYDDASFDVVLFCEVLEHMTDDPVAAVREIARVLRPGGRLVLTTPNAARLENVGRLIVGLNVADQYSGYGPYGRHNREYTVPELVALMTHCGFAADILYTADVYPNPAAVDALTADQLAAFSDERRDRLGQYQFSRWRRVGEAAQGRPDWLYRSLPPGELSSAIPLHG